MATSKQKRYKTRIVEALPRIWVDWNDMWGSDLVDLGLPCSIQSFEEQGIAIQAGLQVRIFGDELEADAIVVLHEYNNHKFFCAKIVEGTMIDIPYPSEPPPKHWWQFWKSTKAYGVFSK